METELEQQAVKEIENNITKNEIRLRESFGKKDKKEGIHALAKYIVEKHNIKTTTDGRRDVFYIYGQGVYEPVEESTLKREAEMILDKLLSNHYTSEIIGKIKRMTFCERDNLGVKDKNLICVENGILNLETRQLIEHSPDMVFFRKIPVRYDPDIDCPKIKEFFESLLDKEDMPLIQEWFGFPLYREYFLKKALIIYGERNTGKSTLLNLMTRFVGKQNTSGLALQQLETDRFGTIELHRKYLNIYDDLGADDVRNTGAFKMATGRSYITAERKFGDRFKFMNFAKMVFSANKIPSTKEIDEDAYYSRWILLEFDRRFEGKDNDPYILEKITTPEELSGLLNWALIGLERLRKTNEFSYTASVEEVKQLMIMAGSVVSEFAYTQLEEATGEYISKEKMYEVFQGYSRSKKMPIITKEKFGRRLLKYSSYVQESRKTVDGKQPRVWLNIRLKNQ